jgi:glutaconyl-CoA/methylmalonyl-CoA decarboxylase subunit gamma
MNKFKYKINGTIYEVDILDVKDETAKVEVNGKTYEVEIQKEAPKPKPQKAVIHETETDSAEAFVIGDGPAKFVKAPLPGVIIKVLVKPGDKVKPDQDVCTLETMKMENAIKAEEGGVVTAVNVSPGQSVQQEEVLIELK